MLRFLLLHYILSRTGGGDVSYVYLDWNVVKYMKNHRSDHKSNTDEYFTALIFDLARKGVYSFPYSEAHIKDRANKYQPEYLDLVLSDLKFFSLFNKSMCLGTIDSLNKLGYVKKDIVIFFNEYITEQKRVPNTDDLLTESINIKVDLEHLDKQHPLYNLAKRNFGIITPQVMVEHLMEMYQVIFGSSEDYKRIRNYIPSMDICKDSQQIKETEYGKKLFEHLSPFFATIDYDEKQLKKCWKNVCEKWFSLNSKSPTKEQLLIQGYALLDFHPLFREKLKANKNTLDNIIRDSNHVYYASEAECFISEDKNTREKTKFIYEVFDIATKVVSEKEFLEIIDCNLDVIYL